MSSTKRKIYIALIIICFLGTGAVLYYGLAGPVAPPAPGAVNTQPIIENNPTPTSNSAQRTGTANLSAPAVFPLDTKFDFTLFQSDTYKSLKSIPDLVLDPATIGTNNPF